MRPWRPAPESERPSARAAKERAASVTARKSRWRPMRLRSQVYSSCFERHSRESPGPLPGKSASQRAATEWTSKSVP